MLKKLGDDLKLSKEKHEKFIEDEMIAISNLDREYETISNTKVVSVDEKLRNITPEDYILLQGPKSNEYMELICDMHGIESVLFNLSILLQNEQISTEKFIRLTRKLSREYFIGDILRKRV